MGILAIDIGTKMGWAFYGPPITSGTICFAPGRFEGGGMRYLRFSRWLKEVHATSGIDEIHFEEVRRHLGVDAAHAYGGFLAHLTAFADEHNIPYKSETVQAIKRFISGRGNANKKEVIACVKERGYFPKDDNEADAIALLLLVLMKNKQIESRIPLSFNGDNYDAGRRP